MKTKQIRQTNYEAMEREVLAGPLGDLIVRALVRDIPTDNADAQEAWSTLDNQLLKQASREMRCISHAMATRNVISEELPETEFTSVDANKLWVALERRLAAAAELSRRLREARWGDPRFGGSSVPASPSGVFRAESGGQEDVG